jgi:hypothetical protein
MEVFSRKKKTGEGSTLSGRVPNNVGVSRRIFQLRRGAKVYPARVGSGAHQSLKTILQIPCLVRHSHLTAQPLNTAMS